MSPLNCRGPFERFCCSYGNLLYQEYYDNNFAHDWVFFSNFLSSNSIVVVIHQRSSALNRL